MDSHKTCSVWCICFLSLLLPLTRAGAQDYVFNQLSSANRISDYYVLCAIKDSRGFMWFGTEDGLNRFDGYNYKVYKHDPSDTSSLPGNYITSLADDGDFIWVGTLTGLSRYSKKSDAFTNYLHGDDVNSLSSNNVKSVLRDSKGRIWIGTFNGLNLYNHRNNNFSRFIYTPNENNYNQVYEIRTLVESHSGNLWMGTTKGLFRFNTSTHVLTKFRFDKKNTSNNNSWVACIYEDQKNNLWIGTNGSGLYYFDFLKDKSYQYLPSNQPSSIRSNEITSVVEDADRNIWIGTVSGLSLIEKGDIAEDMGITFTNSFRSFEDQRIISNIISGLYRDNTNIIWICGRFDLITVSKRLKPFTHINFVKTDSRFATNNTTAIVEDKNGNIWFGTDGGGIYFWNRENNSYKVYRHDPAVNNSLASDKVLALCLDSFDNLWIGYWAAGLDKIDLKTNKIKHYRFNATDNTSINGDNIYSLYEDREKKLWIGYWTAGIGYYNREKDCFFRVPGGLKYPELLVGYSVISIGEDNQHNLLLATEASGFRMLNTRTLRFRDYVQAKYDTNSISTDRLIQCYQDSKGHIWLTSQNGLNLFDPVTGSFRKFYEKDGLSSNKTRYILEDKSGNFWISTDNGISRLTVKQNNGKYAYEFRRFDMEDDLQEIQFKTFSYGKTENGEILFGSRSGVTMFNPDSIMDNQFRPPIVFTGLNRVNKPVEVGIPGSVLEKDINETDELVLSYKDSYFSLEYSALNYLHARKNKYAYKLEGFDTDWIYVDAERKVTYTHLNHGSYVFRVKGCNNDGYWNEEGASLRIRITPPWWETWLFRLLLISLAIVLLILFYYTNVSRIRRKNEMLERVVKQRTFEITRQKEEIEAQKVQLEQNNFRLVEQQHEMEAQTEELQAQTEELYSHTEALAQSNAEIQRQHDEITKQAKALAESNLEIQKQRDDLEAAYKELNMYRNQLEQLVDERTRELILSKEKAEESDRLKSSFLANISHEIRTPLNAIIGFSGLLSDPGISNAERDSYNFIIRQSSDALLHLINDVIDFSKIEAGHLDVDLTQVPISHIVNRVNDIFSLELKKELTSKEYLVDFSMNVPKNLLPVMIHTDEMRLMQIISNLINNAVKFTNHGFIEFGCRNSISGPWIELYVKDTGIGIKKENQALIFQRFRKLEDDKRQLYRGAGLGLAISSELIGLLGGHISVESEPDVGSVFTITVPINMSSESLTAETFPEAKSDRETIYPDFSDKNILIAEDDSTNYLFLEKLLRRTGAVIIHALNGLQAVSLAASNKDLHLILMDIKMPEMDGIEALKIIRESHNQVPVIALTAHALSGEVRKLKEAGFDNYVTKPIKINEFLHSLELILLGRNDIPGMSERAD
jgi:signal transduction histidine kinase/ligand-binding sensor domain-containing protein/CheY-like chemotaxis protein